MQDRLEEITPLVTGIKSYSMNLLLTGPASNSTN